MTLSVSFKSTVVVDNLRMRCWKADLMIKKMTFDPQGIDWTKILEYLWQRGHHTKWAITQ